MARRAECQLEGTPTGSRLADGPGAEWIRGRATLPLLVPPALAPLNFAAGAGASNFIATCRRLFIFHFPPPGRKMESRENDIPDRREQVST